MTFDDVQRLWRGAYRIDSKEFQEILASSIGASRDYAKIVWSRYQDNPIGYISTRVPAVQGRMLFELAWKKGEVP